MSGYVRICQDVSGYVCQDMLGELDVPVTVPKVLTVRGSLHGGLPYTLCTLAYSLGAQPGGVDTQDHL